jgi:hypothetical protein
VFSGVHSLTVPIINSVKIPKASRNVVGKTDAEVHSLTVPIINSVKILKASRNVVAKTDAEVVAEAVAADAFLRAELADEERLARAELQKQGRDMARYVAALGRKAICLAPS